jgi:hypothetical protein
MIAATRCGVDLTWRLRLLQTTAAPGPLSRELLINSRLVIPAHAGNLPETGVAYLKVPLHYL